MIGQIELRWNVITQKVDEISGLKQKLAAWQEKLPNLRQHPVRIGQMRKDVQQRDVLKSRVESLEIAKVDREAAPASRCCLLFIRFGAGDFHRAVRLGA